MSRPQQSILPPCSPINGHVAKSSWQRCGVRTRLLHNRRNSISSRWYAHSRRQSQRENQKCNQMLMNNGNVHRCDGINPFSMWSPSIVGTLVAIILKCNVSIFVISWASRSIISFYVFSSTIPNLLWLHDGYYFNDWKMKFNLRCGRRYEYAVHDVLWYGTWHDPPLACLLRMTHELWNRPEISGTIVAYCLGPSSWRRLSLFKWHWQIVNSSNYFISGN